MCSQVELVRKTAYIALHPSARHCCGVKGVFGLHANTRFLSLYYIFLMSLCLKNAHRSFLCFLTVSFSGSSSLSLCVSYLVSVCLITLSASPIFFLCEAHHAPYPFLCPHLPLARPHHIYPCPSLLHLGPQPPPRLCHPALDHCPIWHVLTGSGFDSRCFTPV